MNVPDNGGKDRILFCQVLCSITSLGAYIKRNTSVDIQCLYVSEIHEWLLILSR